MRSTLYRTSHPLCPSRPVFAHLGPVAQMERGPVEEVVVPCREAVDQVEGETAEEGGQGVLRHPPDFVGQVGRGEGARDEAGVVRADDRVEEDLLQTGVEVCLGDRNFHADELGRGGNSSCSRQIRPVCPDLVLVDFHPSLAARRQVNEG